MFEMLKLPKYISVYASFERPDYMWLPEIAGTGFNDPGSLFQFCIFKFLS